MVSPLIHDTKCPSCGASLQVPSGVTQITCRYCQNVLSVENKAPPPIAQFNPRIVYLNPNAAARAGKNIGCMIAIFALVPVLIPILIGVGPLVMRSCKGSFKPFPVTCALNEDAEVSGNFETTGPIVTSVGHNCKLHIKNAKLKGSTLVKTESFNMELTLENVTIETTDVMIHTGSNLKLNIKGSTLTSASNVVDTDTNVEFDVEDSTIESKNAAAIKSKHNLKVRTSGGKFRGKKAALDTDANLQVTMKKNSEFTSSDGPAIKTSSSFKLDAEGGKIDGGGGGIVASSSSDLTATGLTVNSTKEKAIVTSSASKLDFTDSTITSTEAEAIEADSSVEIDLANTKVQGGPSAINTKGNTKFKVNKKSRIVSTSGYGILTVSNTELTLADAAIEAGSKAFKGATNDKIKLQAGARLAGKKGGIEVEGNFELDATGAVIEGGTGPAILGTYGAKISVKQGSVKGVPALQFSSRPSTLDLAGATISGDQRLGR